MSDLSPEDVVPKSVLAALGLSAYRPLPGGVWSEELLASVQLGNDGEQLLLKEKRAYLSDAEFRLHIALHRFMSERGGPVAPLPPSLAARMPLRLQQHRLVEAQVWVRGREVDPESPADAAVAGRALAQFHRAALGFPWPEDPWLHQEPRDRFGKATFYRPLLARALGDPEHPLLGALYEVLGSARASLPNLAHEQPLHGDPAPDNFLIGEGTCVLLDLDDAHWGAPEEDLAWLVTTCGALAWQPRGQCLGVRERWAQDFTRATVESYGTERCEPSDPGSLRPWLVASVVCAVGDCLTDSGRSILTQDELEEHCRRALRLIDQTEDVEP